MCSAKLPNSMNYCLACGNHPEPEPVYVMKVYSTRKTWRSEATCLMWLATLLATGSMSSQTRCARLEEEQSGRITSTLPTVKDTTTCAEIHPEGAGGDGGVLLKHQEYWTGKKRKNGTMMRNRSTAEQLDQAVVLSSQTVRIFFG